MTNAELIEWEKKIRHEFHRIERALAVAKASLESLADELAKDRGIDPSQRSGGDDKPEDPPPGGE
jgi:hypothetical protein